MPSTTPDLRMARVRDCSSGNGSEERAPADVCLGISIQLRLSFALAWLGDRCSLGGPDRIETLGLAGGAGAPAGNGTGNRAATLSTRRPRNRSSGSSARPTLGSTAAGSTLAARGGGGAPGGSVPLGESGAASMSATTGASPRAVGRSALGMLDLSRSIAAAETSTADGGWAAYGSEITASRNGSSGLGRGGSGGLAGDGKTV